MAKRLFDEASVRAMPAGSELVLAPGDLATPAALDLAFARRIRVRRVAEEGAAPAGGKPGCRPELCALWHAMLGADGTYVVEVRGGRPRVARLTDGGPVPLGGGS